MADTQLTPFDMGTFGSRTTPDMSRRLRRTAAAAREMLIDLAAETWKADRAALSADERRHRPRQRPRRTLEYGKLTKGRKLTKAVSDATADHASGKLDRRRHSAAEGRRPLVRHRQASVCLGHPASGHVVRQGAAPAVVWRDAGIGRHRRCRSMPDVVVVRDGDFVGVAAPSDDAGVARPGRDQGGMESRSADLRQGPLRELEVSKAVRARGRARRQRGPGEPVRSRKVCKAARCPSRADVYHRLHRPCAARAASGRGGVGKWQADRLDRNAAALRRARRADRAFGVRPMPSA